MMENEALRKQVRIKPDSKLYDKAKYIFSHINRKMFIFVLIF